MKNNNSASSPRPDSLTNRVISFLAGIGIQAEVCDLEPPTFLPGISIERGVLRIDPRKMRYPGDLLHEAGHIAVVPAAERATLNCDSIALRPERGAEEMMAMGWSYAAAVHLGIDPEVVFHGEGYQGNGENLLKSLRDEHMPLGVPMLQYHGLCRYGTHAAESGLPAYPIMLKWTLD